ncbi:MAG: hypothetical protein WC560_06510 [Syntrophales bacterium]
MKVWRLLPFKPIDIAMLCNVVREGAEERLGVRFEEQDMTTLEEEIKAHLLRNKYSTDRWNLEGKVTGNEF